MIKRLSVKGEGHLNQRKLIKYEYKTGQLEIYQAIGTPLPEYVYKFPLQELQLQKSPIDFRIHLIATLTKLMIVSVDLTQVVTDICRLTQLEVLCMVDSELTELPSKLSNLTNLRTLDLSDNKLTQLPILDNLRSLDQSLNPLTEIPSEISRSTNLEILVLTFNQLTFISPDIVHLTKLKGLNLSHNRLVHIPPLPKTLVYLDFGENLIETIECTIGQFDSVKR